MTRTSITILCAMNWWVWNSAKNLLSLRRKRMKKRLKYLLFAILGIVSVTVSCVDYSSQIQELNNHLAQLEWQREETAREAESLETLIAAVQAGDELVEFSPVAEDGGIAGFKVVFKDAGEIVIYNQPSYISVTEDDGHYYWMAGGRYLTDSSGNRLEISPETPVPQFRVNAGVLEVSADGGNRFTRLGNIDKCLIESVSEDASQVVFRLSGGAVVTIPKPQALKLYMDGDGRSIGAGETVTVTYRIEGAENAGITAICGDGWRVEVTPATSTEGTIKVTAPSPVSEDKVIVFASDGKGRMVAVEMRLTVDESTNPEPPGPEVILRPVSQAYNVTKAGGEIVAPLVTNVEYTVSTDAAWLRYAGTKGERTDNLVFTVQPNDDAARAAVATISSGNYSTTIAFYQAGEARTLELSEYGMEFDSGGGSRFLTVTSNIDYEFEVSDGWVTIVQPNVVTPSIYVVTVEANPTISDRSASITFSGDRVPTRVLEITQEGQAPYMTVTGGPFEFGNDGGSGSVTVAANVEVGYTIEGGEGWLEITAQTEPGKYLLTVSRNDSFDARSATVTFSGDMVDSQSFTVTQSASFFTLSPTSMTFEPSGGSGVISVTTNLEYSYTVSDGADWLSISVRTTDNGKEYTVTAVANGRPEPRSATVTFTGEVLQPHTVTITQKASAPYFNLSKTALEFECSGGSGTFTVSTNVEYTYTVSEGAEWLTVTSQPTSTGAAFSVTASDNTAASQRSATVIFAGASFQPQSVTITQGAMAPYLNVSPEALSFDSIGGSRVLTISTNVDYTFSVSSQNWLTVKNQGSGTNKYTVQAASNDTFDSRSATITFSSARAGSRRVVVSQDGQTPYLTVYTTSISFENSGGTRSLSVSSNVAYTVSDNSDGWLTVTGTPGQGSVTFYVTAAAHQSTESRSAVITFASEKAGSRTVQVTQQGWEPPLPYGTGGSNLYTSTGDYHYRYGPSIIRNSDGSIDVWTAKEGGNYASYADYAYQETGSRSKAAASGHTYAQYFNVQHKFAAIQLRLYGTATSSDAITIKLYKWAGSYGATIATSPIASKTFSSISSSSSGNVYRVSKSGGAMMEAGEYLWTATGASSGVGLFKRAGAGTISITDAVSYADGSAVSNYNFEMKLRGRATGSYYSADIFAYYHSDDGGATWSVKDRNVLFGTEGFEDQWSVCDPGAAHFGGWYYLAYTSAKGEPGIYNHCYVARSETPMGPWYKWNGSGWGGEPAKIITFTGTTSQWGAGEPSIVVKDNVIYFYYTWTEGANAEDHPTTHLATAPLSEDWPAHLTIYGKVIDKSQFTNADSSDIKYVEDYGLFYAFHTHNRYRYNSEIAVWTSPDGKHFTYRGNMTGVLKYVGNMGVSGDGEGHMRISEQQYVGYSYGSNSTGNWSTWFGPMYFE